MKILLIFFALVANVGFSRQIEGLGGQKFIQSQLVRLLKLQIKANKNPEFHFSGVYFGPRKIGISAYYIAVDEIAGKSKLLFSVFPNVSDKEQTELDAKTAGLDAFKFSTLKFEKKKTGRMVVDKFTYFDSAEKIVMARWFNDEDGFEVHKELYDREGNKVVSEFNEELSYGDKFEVGEEQSEPAKYDYQELEKEFSNENFKIDDFCLKVIKKKFRKQNNFLDKKNDEEK